MIMDTLVRTSILGVPYHNITVPQALAEIGAIMDGGKKADIFFLNAECLRIAQKDKEYQMILMNADYVFSDGIGLKLLTRLYGQHLVDNCNGTDLSPKILEICAH